MLSTFLGDVGMSRRCGLLSAGWSRNRACRLGSRRRAKRSHADPGRQESDPQPGRIFRCRLRGGTLLALEPAPSQPSTEWNCICSPEEMATISAITLRPCSGSSVHCGAPLLPPLPTSGRFKRNLSVGCLRAPQHAASVWPVIGAIPVRGFCPESLCGSCHIPLDSPKYTPNGYARKRRFLHIYFTLLAGCLQRANQNQPCMRLCGWVCRK